MKKSFLYPALCLVAAMVFTACSNDDTGGTTLTLDPERRTLAFSADATEQYQFAVTSSISSWEVEVTPAEAALWCKAAKGEDGITLTVTAEPNLQADPPAEATITVSAGRAKVVLTAAQEGAGAAFIRIEPQLEDISFFAGAEDIYEFTVTTNREWDVEAVSSGTWLHVEKTEEGNGFTVSASVNPEMTGREGGTVTVTPRDGDPTVIKAEQKGMEIYVAGYVYDSENKISAAYWRNGQQVTLPDHPDFAPANHYAHDIFVDAEGVHVVGVAEAGFGVRAIMYWKNDGQPLVLTSTDNNNTGIGNGIWCYEGDVYICGYEGAGTNYVAKYWKNLYTEYELTNEGEVSTASSIYVHNGDVYVTGRDGNIATYWKNGQGVALSDGDATTYVVSVVVSGEDVYSAGYGLNANPSAWTPYYAVNGQKTYYDHVDYGMVYGNMYVDGDDIYLAGSVGSGWLRHAVYWKNGEQVQLSVGENRNACANGVVVWDGDVYAAGMEWTDERKWVAKHWKNGTAVNYTDGSTDAITMGKLQIR